MKVGQYRARATGAVIDNQDGDVRFGMSANGGEQVAVRLVVTSAGECEGEHLWWIGSFANAQAVDITVRGMRDLGARLADGRITDLEGLGSKETNATVKEEEWDGKKRFKVSIGGGNFTFKQQLDAGGLAALEARLRGGIVAASSKGRPAGASQGPRAGAGDDIPF